MKKIKKTICVIGVGRFGSALVDVLLENKCDIIAIDNNEERLLPYKEKLQSLYILDSLDRESLLTAGVNNADVVIIGIGSSIEQNLIASLSAIELGVKKVIAKELSKEHGNILRKIGAEPINVESAMGERLGHSLMSSALDFLRLCKNFSVMELAIPKNFDGKTVLEVNLRAKYNINIIAIVRENGEAFANITPNSILKYGEYMIISGENKDLLRFQEL